MDASREHPQGEAISEACERLGATLIHEMRHPLLGIKAGLELLALSGGEGVTGSVDFRMVRLQVLRLEELFRTYQQLFARDAPPPVPFAVADAARRSVELLEYRLGKVGARFSFAADPEARGVGNPNALIHALTNLIANALDAVEQTGAAGRVAVRALSAAGGGAEVRVSDEGPGIAAQDEARLFVPWFTTKPAGKGTGLGLQIARTLMVRYGGDVRLVQPGDPLRLTWAKAEFALVLPPG